MIARIRKYGTGDKVPDGSVFLSTTMFQGNGNVAHYFLVYEDENGKIIDPYKKDFVTLPPPHKTQRIEKGESPRGILKP